jgi:hypothetical protein
LLPNQKDNTLVKQLISHGNCMNGHNGAPSLSSSLYGGTSHLTLPTFTQSSIHPPSSSCHLTSIPPKRKTFGQHHTAAFLSFDHMGQSFTIVPTTAMTAAAAMFAGPQATIAAGSVTEEEDGDYPWESANAAVTEHVDDDLLLAMHIDPPPAIPLDNITKLGIEEEYQLTTNGVTLMHVGTTGWYLDLGATMTCTPNKEELSYVKLIMPIPIYGVGGAQIFTSKVGTLSINLWNGSVFKMPNVLVVKGAAICLISIRRLANQGYGTYFRNPRTALIAHGDHIVATASCAGPGLYAVNLNNEPSALFAATTEHVAHVAVGLDVWHSLSRGG